LFAVKHIKDLLVFLAGETRYHDNKN